MPFGLKATNEQIIESYTRLKNVWEVAKEFGMCGQSVHERVVKLGIVNEMNVLSDADRKIIIDEYEHYASTGQLKVLAKKLKRTRHLVCRYAKEMGLTDIGRKKIEFKCFDLIRGIPMWTKGDHPRGMLGKKHTEETLDKLSIQSKRVMKELIESGRMRGKTEKMCETKLKKYGTLGTRNRAKCSWKAGWRIISEQKYFFRSSWEANYARFLEIEKSEGRIANWEHEPLYFKFEKEKTGSVCFLPDFRVTKLDGAIEYHEVKGWFDERSIETLTRMKIHFPSMILIVIPRAWFRKYNREYSKSISEWEKLKL